MTRHRRLQDQMSFEISLPTDENGLTGRECPNDSCLGYFKVKFGTGLKGDDLPCVCPYCGHTGPHDTFWTQEQLKYAESIAMQEVTGLVVQELKKMEFDVKPQGAFGIGFSMKVKPGAPHPICYYREKELETSVDCSTCTLVYAIYGVFGHCPDCGVHNSLQILEKNLELAAKELKLAEVTDDRDLKSYLIGDALENAVSAFDGFGREAARTYSHLSSDCKKASSMSFQNLRSANDQVHTYFGFRLNEAITPDDWSLLIRCLQKRHLLAHNMGVIDDKYIASANDATAQVGRKVTIDSTEATALLVAVKSLGKGLMQALKNLAEPASPLTQSPSDNDPLKS